MQAIIGEWWRQSNKYSNHNFSYSNINAYVLNSDFLINSLTKFLHAFPSYLMNDCQLILYYII